MSKIGILGGTFDPVHIGHLHLALDAKEQAQLDEVWFMPAKIQPFKQDHEVTGEEHRLKMLEMAISGSEGLSVSTLEMELTGISYTYRTLREVRRRLREARPGEETAVFFITGTDTFIKMDSWMHAEELLRENAIIVGRRPGYRDEEIARCRKKYETLCGTEVVTIHNDQIDISSTEVKEMLVAGASIADYVPSAVVAYILSQGLYR